jgi:hypothetical protein
MSFMQSALHRLLVGILAIAGVSDATRFNVPRLVAQARAARAAFPVSATWDGTSSQGRPVSLLLNADGATVTGRLALDGQSGAVEDGRIEKGIVTFAVVIAGRTLTFAGEAAAGEMTLRPADGRSAMTLRRIK